MIKYKNAIDIQSMIAELSKKLDMDHIDTSKVICIRSVGSKSRGTIARCHALPRVMKFALGTDTHYVIEVISENFDSLDEEEKIKTLIHELLHIPKSFGGGFRYHSFVNETNIQKMYKKYKQAS